MRFAPVLFLLFLAPQTALPSSHEHDASRMTGWEAFSELQNGNTRFYEARLTHPRQDSKTREQLASGQKPHTIILSCSDSRVPPEEIFDQGLGDLFVVRLAGNVVSKEAIASIEYAVEHLGAKLLLVMGHESCGAVGAAISTKPGNSAGSESLDSLVQQIRKNLTIAGMASASTDKTFRRPVKENVAANTKELLRRSEILRHAVNEGDLVVGQALYGLKSGRVEFWDMGTKPKPAELPIIREQVVKEEIIPSEETTKKKSLPTH